MGDHSALMYTKKKFTKGWFENTNKFYPWKSVFANDENFLEFEATLHGETTSDVKGAVDLIVLDPRNAELSCLKAETYSTTLTQFPSYVPRPCVRTWILEKLTDDEIRKPLLHIFKM